MKILAIVNNGITNSSAGKLESVLKEKFAHLLVHIERTKNPQEVTAITRDAVLKDVDTIVAVGGDGTLNSVLNSITGSEVAVGIIPLGTANDLASFFSIPNDVARACNVILQRNVRRVDLIRVNDYCFVTNGGLGLPCEVVRLANSMKSKSRAGNLMRRIFGPGLYLGASLRGLIKRGEHPVTIRSNGTSFTGNVMMLTINNQPFAGKKFVLAPGATNDDGVFDVCLVEPVKSTVQFIRFLSRALDGSHINLPFVKIWKTDELTVEVEEPVPFLGDGEIFPPERQFRISIVPRALRLIVPREGV